MKAKRILTLSLSVVLVLVLMLPCFTGMIGAAASSSFPFGTVLVDFEDNVDGIEGDGKTMTLSTDNVTTGQKSLEIASDTASGYSRVKFTLGTALGADGSDVLNTKYIGFHIKAPKGGTTAGENTVVIRDLEISGQEWWQYAQNSTYWLLADGATEWEEKTMNGSGVVLTGEFSGYVLLDVNTFKRNGGSIAGTNADKFSPQYPNYLQFYFDWVGGDYGSAYLDSVFYSTEDLLAPGKTFPLNGTVLLDFENNIDGIESDGKTLAFSTDNVTSGKKSLEIASDTASGYSRVKFTLGTALGADGSDVLNTKYIGFHIKAPKGGTTAGENTVVIRDLEISGQNWWQHISNATYWVMADGETEWEEKTMNGSGVVLTGEFSGYVLLDINNFWQNRTTEGTNADKFSNQYANYLQFYFDWIGGDYGSAYLDSVFYSTADLTASSKTFPLNGTVLLDFEDNVDGIEGDGKTLTSSTDNVTSGKKSLEIASATASSYSRVKLTLGTALGADGSDVLNTKYIGFHIKAPKGGTTAGENTVVIRDLEISGQEWWQYAQNSTYWLLADGATEWEEKTMNGSGVVLTGEFSGYVLLDVNTFKRNGGFIAGTNADKFSPQYPNYLQFYFDWIGGDYGSAYLDSVFYSTADMVSPSDPDADLDPNPELPEFTMGTLLMNFEDGISGVRTEQSTASVSTDHAIHGSNSVMFSSDTVLGWGASKVYFDLGQALGAEDSDALNMKYIGFHIAGLKGNVNDIKSGSYVLQDIILNNGDEDFAHESDSTYWLLADGETTWTEGTSIGSGSPIPSEFSGYVVFDVTCFGADNAAQLLNATGNTQLSFHFNQIGGDYGSAYVDTIFYSTDADLIPNANEEDEDLPSFEDVDEPSFDYDEEEIASINGTGSGAPASQIVYILNNLENGRADLKSLLAKTAANKLKGELSNLHTGDGKYSMKLSSPYAQDWNSAVPYMVLGNGLGAEDLPSSRMTYIGFHIQTAKTDWFLVQDIQLSSDGKWYTLAGNAPVYVMQDGADQWSVATRDANSIQLPGNWSGFVVLPINGFLHEKDGVLVPAEVFSKTYATCLQMHFNNVGYTAESVYLDTFFYSTETAFDLNAPQLVDADGNYVAGKSTAPTEDVLTSIAPNEKVLDIDGYRVFARENTVGGLKQLLQVKDGLSIVISAEGEIPADTDEIATGMVIYVMDGDTKVAAYVIADVRATPVPERDFILQQRLDDAVSPVIITGKNIKSQGFTVKELFEDYLKVSFGAVATVYDNDTALTDDQAIKQGMVIRVYDPVDPDLYNEYTLSDVEEIDITNGLELIVNDASKVTVKGDTLYVKEGVTVGELKAAVEGPVNLFAIVLDENDMTVDDETAVAAGMAFLLVNEVYDEMGRWNIVVEDADVTETPDASDSDIPATGVVTSTGIFGLLTAAAYTAFVTRKKKS